MAGDGCATAAKRLPGRAVPTIIGIQVKNWEKSLRGRQRTDINMMGQLRESSLSSDKKVNDGQTVRPYCGSNIEKKKCYFTLVIFLGSY